MPRQPTATMAGFLSRLTWEQVPPPVVHEAKRSLMNFVGCALAGCDDPTIRIADEVLAQLGSSPLATVLGRRTRAGLLDAAFLNAASANVFDFDDTHARTIIHPTSPVAPPLLALAESSKLSGRQMLIAFVAGVEAECRIGNAISPGHYQRGWHITSTCGVFGAAAASARLLGLDSLRTGWALGNASAQACGLVETLGTMSKSLSVGNAARNGLLSALLAKRGFSGPQHPLEGERGFLRVTADAPDFACLTSNLGEQWELQSNTYKPYPCGVVLNPVIEACLELARDPALSVAAIERIELTGHPLLRERTDRPHPASGREAQVSAQHAVAVSLIRARAGLPEFSDEAAADPAVRALGARVRFMDDERFTVESARVSVSLRDGAPISRRIESARGSTTRPLTDGDLEDKLRALCAFGGSGCDPEPWIEAIWEFDRVDDVGATIQRLSAGPDNPSPEKRA